MEYAMTQTSYCKVVFFPLKYLPRVPTSNIQLSLLGGARLEDDIIEKGSMPLEPHSEPTYDKHTRDERDRGNGN